ncbi:zinc finger C3H1 domain-containing protein, partial [Electrophorus electricus]|uniref:zinc finger C3H1 domain-containing protein n=1 Tax=Electrophorus electricus TaxID=8005 RepID=UPI0015CFC0B2
PQLGPSGPERLPPGPGCEASPRASFWERSHGALARLRYRGKPSDGRGGWDRGTGAGRDVGRPPQSRCVFGENHSNRKDSPTKKQKQSSRIAVRKQAYLMNKSENGVDESFEELLMKYKQIQLELECIRKEEKKALKPSEGSPQQEEASPAVSTLEETASRAESVHPEVPAQEQEEKKVFQAFNIRPLRQKLLTPAERDALNTRTADEVENKEVEQNAKSPDEPTTPKEAEEDGEESESDLNISVVSKGSDGTPCKVKGRDEDDELSELQLRLLALQSASRRWQQKEQQVMKESKERLNRTRTAPERAGPAPPRPRMPTRASCTGRGRPGPGSRGLDKGKAVSKGHPAKKMVNPAAAKQAWRKQQVRTWKLQRQQEEQKHEEEEERRKREDEIRKIRDLSNQDEQYNRFMMLVGGKQPRTRSKSSDADHRKVLFKQGVDTSGNLYQYDNYDEVAMDTDSETNSPSASPTRELLGMVGSPYLIPLTAFSLDSAPLTQEVPDASQCGVDPLGVAHSTLPPPPPPLPPVDELVQPPKPPFADEEEEEEMMLREELLKSLASKRAVRPEDTSSNSGPPSPAMRPAAPPTAKSATSSVGFSSGPLQTRPSGKFGRGAPPPRAPLVVRHRSNTKSSQLLPRHKAVVVRLNASDDSDSEGEASSSVQSVFGGLESMIKEARRTVEASKPRPVPVCEKENNPLRPADALIEAKKSEYRLLREQLASQEKQRVGRPDAAVGGASPVGVDLDVDVAGKVAELQLADIEDKFTKHCAQLEKDQVLLQHLQHQELRKKESLKAAEAKVVRLREQLLASERVASATRLLLRKLQEQVQRVQQRVTVKQHQALRLERELLVVQAAASRGSAKRSSATAPTLSPGKRRRLGVPDAHYVELIAQKQRLQQLETEYAQKIQQLKEAQALRQAYAPPQPSLHDLTQDKLALASEDPDPEEEELQPAPASSVRRRSFRESGSFTKPKLGHSDTPSTPTTPAAPTKPTQDSGSPPPELLLLGLNLDSLRQHHQRTQTLSDLLLHELRALGGAMVDIRPSARVAQVDFDPMAPQRMRADLKPVTFGPYRSPLLLFRSYRFSPYFRTKEKLSLSSVTYSNVIEPKKCFCRFDLTGTCNDDECQWQHMRNCTLNGNQLFQDILSYSLPLIGCSEENSTSEICRATEKYIKKLFSGNKDLMGTDQKAVLLVSKVNESVRHVPPYTTCKEKRRWRPEPQRPQQPDPGAESEDENATVPGSAPEGRRFPDCCSVSDVCVTQDDKRYFDSETDDISNLEYSVLESPRDVQLWVKLAYKYLNQKDTNASECLDAALNTLSRALEDNQEDVEVWCHYLSLFSGRASRDEVQEMCEMAVEHAPHYHVWWTYLNIESTFEKKDTVCCRMLQYLMEPTVPDGAQDRSFQLLETLLYRVQLSLFTGRLNNARQTLQSALMADGERSVSACLTLAHRCVAWLCYIHLCEFGVLPSHLYDPTNSNPSRIVSLEPFLLPWSSTHQLDTPPDRLLSLFHDALIQCVDERVSPVEQMLACLLLHTNHLHLLRVLGRHQEAIAVCESLLSVCAHCCPLLEIQSELHMVDGEQDRAAGVWLRAHALCPRDAQIFYHLCRCLHALERSSVAEELFEKFLSSFCSTVPTGLPPVAILRHLLSLPPQDLQQAPPTVQPHLQEELRAQLPYLSLMHSWWQSVYGSVVDALDAFEAALGSVSALDLLQKLWLNYLQYTSSKLPPGGRELRVLAELVQRCLATVPSRLTLPYNSTTYWSSYDFHNQVIAFYLSFLPAGLHASVLERFRHTMPTNMALALRLVQQEKTDGGDEQVRLHAKQLASTIPSALASWKIAIAVQREEKRRAQVQRLYHQALQKLPLCASLWKDWLLFEAAGGGKTDTLKKLVAKCQEVGVSLSEPLSLGLNSSHAQDP